MECIVLPIRASCVTEEGGRRWEVTMVKAKDVGGEDTYKLLT